MRVGLIGLLLLMGLLDLAHADTFHISVRSGFMERVHMYTSWKRTDCTPNKGVVKVLVKPQHGKLSPYELDTVIKRNRFRANDPCIGKTIRGFEVNYQSDPNFQGSDTFQIESTYGNRKPVIDVYNVTVK